MKKNIINKSLFIYCKKIDDYFDSFNYKLIFYFLILSYLILQAYIFFNSHALVPDEIWYLRVANTEFNFFQRSPPPNDYGSLYWLLLKFTSSGLVSRLIFYFLFILTPLLLLVRIQDYRLRFYSFLFYLSMPLAFWNGKLIGPEILSIFVISCSLFLAQNRPYLSSFFAGLSTGIKLTSLPYCFFIVLIFYLFKNFNRKISYLYVLLFIILGFYFANPLNFDLFIAKIFNSSNIAGTVTKSSILNFNPSKLASILLIEKWEWDLVLSNSFSQSISSPALYLLFILFIALYNVKVSFTYLTFFLVSIFFIYSTTSSYAWYWMPFLPVTIWLFGLNSIPSINIVNLLPNKKFLYAFLLIIFTNIYLNFHIINTELQHKISSIKSIQRIDYHCLNDAILEYRPDVVINKLEFGTTLSSPLSNVTIREYYGSIPNTSEKTMIFFSPRMLINPYNFGSFKASNVFLRFYGFCDESFIFTNQ